MTQIINLNVSNENVLHVVGVNASIILKTLKNYNL